jgi:hypothetical protein
MDTPVLVIFVISICMIIALSWRAFSRGDDSDGC